MSKTTNSVSIEPAPINQSATVIRALLTLAVTEAKRGNPSIALTHIEALRTEVSRMSSELADNPAKG